MAVIFATEADALRQELDAFYTAIGRGEDPRLAIVRLRMAFHRAETIAIAFPEGWIDPDRNQRWGYARLVSVMKVSQYEPDRSLACSGEQRRAAPGQLKRSQPSPMPPGHRVNAQPKTPAATKRIMPKLKAYHSAPVMTPPVTVR